MAKRGVAERIERRKRLISLEKCLLKGFTNQMELAARFGVTQAEISLDIKAILGYWRAPDGYQERKNKRIAQLEYVMQVASEAFVRSRQDCTETTEHLKKMPCLMCEGKGITKDKKGWCKTCEGDGVVPEVQTTVKVRGQAGDPAFLNVVRSCLFDISRLEGHISPSASKTRMSVNVSQQTINVDGSVTTVNKYLSAPPELLLKARAALQQLQEGSKKATNAVEGELVTREEPDEDEE